MKFKFLSLTNLLILLSSLAVWALVAIEIEPFLYFYFHQIGFNTGMEFFEKFVSYPGGISDYLAIFISQFFLKNFFGSFLYVALVFIQALIALNIANRLIGKTKLDFSVFGVILLTGTLVFCDYHYPYYATVRLLLAYVFSWVFSILSCKRKKWSIYLWPAMALLLFYLANGSALIVFGFSSSLILIHNEPKRVWLIAAPAFLIISLLLPYAAFKLAVPSTLENLYRITEDRPPKMLSYTTLYQLFVYYALLPLLLALTFLRKSGLFQPDKDQPVRQRKSIKKAFFKTAPFVLTLQIAFWGAVGYFLFIKSFDPYKKKLLYIEYYAETEQWNDLLKVAEGIYQYDFRVNYQINRAYEHLGQLPEQLFNYPQLLGSGGLFLDASSMSGSFTMPISDLYFDLGLMSESLRWAFEAQTLLPNSPRILKRIILINLINRKYDRAEAFLQVLGKNKLCEDWVARYQQYVTDTTLAAKDPMMVEKRMFSPHKNVVNSNPVENLKFLLETNKNNRMAYDYLLTLLILDSQLNDFVKYVQDYRYYRIKTLPRSWEETLSFYIMKTKAIPPFVDQETISKGCLDRLTQFSEIMKHFKNDKSQAQATLKKNFENTYWYYMLYLSPRVTNILNNKTEIR